MDDPDVITKIKYYEEQITLLETQLNDTKIHLKKYTAPSNMKKYYENHKEEIKQKVKEHKEKTNYVYVPSPEQKKEWARTAYLNKKLKLKKMEEKNEKENI